MIAWRRRNAPRDASRPRLGVLTCLWGRPALTEVVLGHYARLCSAVVDALELEVWAVGSEGHASRDLAVRHGAVYLEHGNQPLGAKWNAGLRALGERGPDAVLIVGSDDLVCERLVRHYGELLRRGARYIALLDAWFLDVVEARAAYWPGYGWSRAREPIGMARCVHAAWLDQVGWELWEPHLERGLDASMTRTLAELMADEPRAVELLSAARHGLVALDVKGAPQDNLWSFEEVDARLGLRAVEADEVLAALGEESAAALGALLVAARGTQSECQRSRGL